MKLMESLVGQQQQQQDGAAPAPARGDAAELAGKLAENGGSPSKKRRRPDGPPTASPFEDASGSGGADGATPGISAGGTPGEPPKPVDLPPFVAMARECGSQEDLKQRLNEHFPPKRGRSTPNTAFRDLFTALCPGQIFSVS